MCVGPAASSSGTLFSPDRTLGTQEIEKRRAAALALGKMPLIGESATNFLASLQTTPGATAGTGAAPVIRFGVPQIPGDALGFASFAIPTHG